MPLLFFIDKEFLEDPACRNLDDVVLSYTFFRYVLSSSPPFSSFIFISVPEETRRGILNLMPPTTSCRRLKDLLTMRWHRGSRIGSPHPSRQIHTSRHSHPVTSQV